MFSIQVDAHERRLIRDPYYDSFPFAGTFVGSYDEENHIITTYKKEFKTGTTYLLWRFNFSSNKLYHDIVSEDSPEQFQLNTGFLPTPENIKKYNVKPELFKYVPDKKTDLSIIYMTFTKWSFNCQSMSYLRYKVQRAIFILYDMLASMG